MKSVGNVLILSGPMGSGHIAAAEAIRENFEKNHPGIGVVHVETSIWMPFYVRWIFLGLYPWVLRHAPWLWRGIHNRNNHSSRGFFPALLKITSASVKRRILEAVEKNAADLVIATHFYPAAILAGAKAENILHIPVCAVVTDHTAHRIYAEPALDRIFVPNELSALRFESWGVPAEKLCVSGCPVAGIFSRSFGEEERVAWKKELGLDEKRSYILLTLGSWCIGHMEQVVRRLLGVHQDFGVIALTGCNEALYRHLHAAEKRAKGRLLAYPYTHEMYKFMAVSEYVVTKPGGITTSECIALGKPMLLVDPIAGHEEKNQKYLVERGVAIAVGAGETVADAISRMRQESSRLHENMRSFSPRVSEAADKIVRQSLDCAENSERCETRVSPDWVSRFRRRFRAVLLGAAAFFGLFGAGCAPALHPEIASHIITSDGSGHPVFYDLTDANGEVIREAGSITLEEHLSNMGNALEKSKRKKLMIYCFGGMNSAEETVEISARNIPVIMDDGDVWPIFVNWESELFECYVHHLLLVRNGMENYWTGPPSVPFFFLSDVFGTLMTLPESIATQTSALWESTEQNEYNQLSRALTARDTGMECYLGGDYAAHSLMPLIRFGYFAGTPLRFFTTSLIDVFGSRAWEEMRRRAHLAFVRDPKEFYTGSRMIAMAEAPADGVFSCFAEMLAVYMKKHPDAEITLIGHSMGSFIVTEFLSRYPQLPVKNIVFMAAASSVRDTALVVGAYLAAHPETHFYNLCLHPFIDRYDMMDYCVLPCGSILTWVDMHLTSPGSKEEYTVGEWEASFLQLPRLMRSVEKQVTLKAFGISDPATNTVAPDIPSQHTDFSSLEAKFWRPEFWRIPEK